MVDWVSSDAILVHAGAVAADPATAKPADREWSDACAAAVSAGFDRRLEGAVWVSPPIEPAILPPELTAAALTAGVELYKRREAVFGVTAFVDLQGAAIRIARDYLAGIEPILARYATVGIA